MDYTQYEGREVIDENGEKLGKISEVLVDPDTQAVQWGIVHTGFFGGHKSFIPLVASDWAGDTLRIPYTKQQCQQAPDVDAEGNQLTEAEEQELARFYGLSYSTAQSASGLVEPPSGQMRAPAGATGDQAMTRSEEQMRVGTIRRPAETVRLVKRVETEPVRQQVPVRREEIRIEREPITEANVDEALSGDPIRENVHEVTAMREEPIVEKTVEPKERVRVEKDIVEEEQEITGEVRKERIEVERG
jgi:stress response protein YsnF